MIDRNRRRRRGHQRITIRLCDGHHFSADIASRAGLVLNHNRLLPDRPKRFSDNARQHVRRTACGERNYNFNSLNRPSLLSACKARQQRRGRRGGKPKGKCASLHKFNH